LVKHVKRKRTRTLKTSKIEVVYFCTECGKQLEDFCFSKEASDLKATHSRFENCKQKKRFKGEACAKLFIAEPVDPFPSDD